MPRPSITNLKSSSTLYVYESDYDMNPPTPRVDLKPCRTRISRRTRWVSPSSLRSIVRNNGICQWFSRTFRRKKNDNSE